VYVIEKSREPVSQAPPSPPAVPPATGPDDRTGGGADLDLETELRAAATGMAAILAGKHARITIAVRPGLRVRTSPSALRAVLHDVLYQAVIDAASHVLLAAASEPGRIRIAVTDNGRAVTPLGRESVLRGAAAMLAMQGGSMQIDRHPGEGMTVALHLPVPLAPTIDHETRPHARPTAEQPALRTKPL
jgi:hypothetical protein